MSEASKILNRKIFVWTGARGFTVPDYENPKSNTKLRDFILNRGYNLLLDYSENFFVIKVTSKDKKEVGLWNSKISPEKVLISAAAGIIDCEEENKRKEVKIKIDKLSKLV